MDAWAAFFVGDITLDELLDSNEVKTSDKDQVKAYFKLFDQVHPNKTIMIKASANK